VFFLVVSLAVIFSVGYWLLTGPRGNFAETPGDFFGFVVLALFPFLLTAFITAIAVARTGSTPFPPNSRTFLGLFSLLIFGAVWAFMVILIIAVSSA
jgi:hypothetical protein